VTTLPAPLSSAVATGPVAFGRICPTRGERLLLRASHALEAFTVHRMLRRACATRAPAADAVERRRTALALGSVGMLPR